MKGLLPLAVSVLLGGCFAERSVAPPVNATRSTEAGANVIGKTLAFTVPAYPSKAPHDFKQDRGHVVLLDVWATWCEPCKEALPLYQDLLTQYAPRGLRGYALSVDEDSRQIAPFIKDARITIPILLDPSAEVAEKQLKVSMMPTLFLVDKKGVIRVVHEGFNGDGVSAFQTEIEALLDERP